MGLSAYERRPRQWLARDCGWIDLCDHRRRPLSGAPFPDRETALASADRRRHSRLPDQLRRERSTVCRLFNGRHSDELCVAGIRTLVAIQKIALISSPAQIWSRKTARLQCQAALAMTVALRVKIFANGKSTPDSPQVWHGGERVRIALVYFHD